MLQWSLLSGWLVVVDQSHSVSIRREYDVVISNE
jgi:hypothetical protein